MLRRLSPVSSVKATACGRLSEAAAREAEIMHCGPKIDFFFLKVGEREKKQNNPAFWLHALLCEGVCVCTCADPCAWWRVRTWLQVCTLWTTITLLKGSYKCCMNP